MLACFAILFFALAPSASAKPDVAKVYLIRGFLGVFSTGLDSIAADLNDRGIPARVTGHLSAGKFGMDIRKAYAQDKLSVRPLVIIGHSFGADAAMNLAKTLDHYGIQVDLLITVDPTSRGPLSGNVRKYINYYFSGNLLGQAIGDSGAAAARVTNIDLSKRPEIMNAGTGHWTVTTNRIIADEIRAHVLRTVR